MNRKDKEEQYHQILIKVLEECKEISCFLERFVVLGDDDEIFEDLKISLQDIDDENRFVNFVRFRCESPEQLGIHVKYLSECKGDPFKKILIIDEMMMQVRPNICSCFYFS